MPRMPCQRTQSTMYVSRMTFLKIFPLRTAVMACVLCCLANSTAFTIAQSDKAPAAADKSNKPADKGASDKSALPPLPAEAHVQQAMQLDDKTLKYTVTVGPLPVR